MQIRTVINSPQLDSTEGEDYFQFVPNEVLAEHMPLNTEMVQALSCVSRRYYSLFKPDTNTFGYWKRLHLSLLELVILADWASVAAFLSLHPISMIFEKTHYQFQEGSAIFISAVEYACKVYDAYMCQLFLKKILLLPQAQQYNYLILFLKQVNGQNTHIDLMSLNLAYEYLNIHQNYIKNMGGNYTPSFDINNSILWIGEEQRELPLHMLKEFSRVTKFNQECSWLATSTFDITRLPRPETLLIFSTVDYLRSGSKVAPPYSFSQLGKTYFLMRNGLPKLYYADTLYPGTALAHDINGFNRLLEVRRADLVTLVQTLEVAIAELAPLCAQAIQTKQAEEKAKRIALMKNTMSAESDTVKSQSRKRSAI